MRSHRSALPVSILALVALLTFASGVQAEPPAPSASAGEVAPPPEVARPRKPAEPDFPTIIPHNLEGRAACLTCHGPAGREPFPSDHVGRPSVACLSCHVPSQSSRAQIPDTPKAPIVTNEFCFACHAKPGLKMTLSGGKELGLFIDKEAYGRSMHGRKHMSCTACHPSNQKHPHEPYTGTTARELNRGIVQERCATCHAELYAKYKESVHGKALVEEGNLDVPTCTDCHGVHSMRDPESMLFRLDSTDTCSKCHADATIMRKYGLSPEVTSTYLADFHGATVRLGKKSGTPDIAQYKAVCYDCHGIHDIKRATDPSSSVVKQNLVETCQRCHPGADDKFPSAWMAHYEPKRDKWPIVYWVNFFYKLAIPGILGGMGLYIGLELFHELVVRIRRRRQR